MLAGVKGRVLAMAPAPVLAHLALLGMLGHALSFSVADTCLHVHTHSLVQSREGEDLLLKCMFQYKHNFTLREVHVLWAKQLATDEYRALMIFDGMTAKIFNKKTMFSTDSLQDGKVSIMLKNATTADSGIYLCDVTVNETNSKGRMQVQVMRAGLVCDEDLQIPKTHKDQQSSPAYGFTNRSLGAIVAVIMLMLVVLSAVAYVKCRKRVVVQRDTA